MPGPAHPAPPSAPSRAGTARVLLWALLMATHLAQAAADGPLPPADLAAQLLQLVNRQRASQALPAWQPDADLAAIATAHSQRMAARRQIGHDGFDARFAQAGRRLCVENLAAGFDRAEPLLAAWLASASHRDNLLALRPRLAGLGQVAGYITLMACE